MGSQINGLKIIKICKIVDGPGTKNKRNGNGGELGKEVGNAEVTERRKYKARPDTSRA